MWTGQTKDEREGLSEYTERLLDKMDATQLKTEELDNKIVLIQKAITNVQKEIDLQTGT